MLRLEHQKTSTPHRPCTIGCTLGITRHHPRHPLWTLCCIFRVTRHWPWRPLWTLCCIFSMTRQPSFYIARANGNPRLPATSRRLSPIAHALRIQKLAITTCKINMPSWQLERETSFNPCVPWCKALHTSSVSSREATPCALLQKEVSQRQQRRSVAPASQRRSVNSAAASLVQRQRRSVAASQRHSVAGPSQRRSATRPPERCSVAAPPAAGSVIAHRRKPTFRPPLPLHCKMVFCLWLTCTSMNE